MLNWFEYVLSVSGVVFLITTAFLSKEMPLPGESYGPFLSTSLFVIVGNIVVMWYLNLNYDKAQGSDIEVFIDSRTSLGAFINSENQKVVKLGLQKFIPVATGIFVEEFEFRDSYNVIIRGEVWQKWPKQLARFYDPGLRFPQEALAGRTLITKISEKERQEFYNTHLVCQGNAKKCLLTIQSTPLM